MRNKEKINGTHKNIGVNCRIIESIVANTVNKVRILIAEGCEV